MTAPTTRETAAHAELAACPFCGGPHLKHIAVYSEDDPTWQIAWQVFCETCHARGPASVRIGWCETEPDASFAWNRRPGEAALLSEIAALRGELSQSRREYRDDVGKHIARATQAERQRDEAVAVIKDVDQAARQAASMEEAGYTVTVQRTATHIYGITAAFLANQGADYD